MADSNGDTITDLVTYLVQEDNFQITVVVYRGLSNGEFDNPVISPIQLDPATGDRLTGEFTKPLNEAQTSYIYVSGNQRTKAAMIVCFDDYGIFRSCIVASLTATGYVRV